jgi:hypothetical protein
MAIPSTSIIRPYRAGVSVVKEDGTVDGSSQGASAYFDGVNSVIDGGTSIDSTLDADWAKVAFLITEAEFDEAEDQKKTYWTSANIKFTDTRMGGNLGINPRPQFTPYSDLPVKGRNAGRDDLTVGMTDGNYGMGRYYSEAIDDNQQTIYLRFGVPQFSSLGTFLTRSFDANLTSLARTGRGLSAWYEAGRIAGAVGVAVAFPAAGAIILGNVLGSWMIDLFFGKSSSKFFTMKPTMHLYWSAVSDLVNAIAVNSGVMPRVFPGFVGSNNVDQKLNSPYNLDDTFLSKLSDLMPDAFTENFGFDIFAIATKAQRIANWQEAQDFQKFNEGSATDYTGILKKSYSEGLNTPTGGTTLWNFIRQHCTFAYYTGDDKTANAAEGSPKINTETMEDVKQPPAGFREYFDAEMRQGSQFAIFKVDNTGATQESFTSSAVESDLQSKFNSTSSSAREARFTFANGNLGDNPIANALSSSLKAVGDVALGALDSVTFGLAGNLAGLAGSGFIDIPRHWQSSTASLPRASYSMQLISPYGNVISRMQNIYIPLSMILAGALPLSTGNQSYTSPFLVQIFDRGRCQIQLGLIESLSISRGTSHLAFTNRGVPLAVDVTFSVMDLSTILHMPISNGTFFGTNETLDGDNILTDYLAVLAGQDMYSQIYPLPKAKLNFAKQVFSKAQLLSPAYWASFVHSSTTTGMLNYIIPGKTIENLLGGSSLVTR